MAEPTSLTEYMVDVLEAADVFLDTDATYGPTDPRTQMKKDLLSQQLQVLREELLQRELQEWMTSKTNVPSLYVDHPEPGRERPLRPFTRDVRESDGWDRER